MAQHPNAPQQQRMANVPARRDDHSQGQSRAIARIEPKRVDLALPASGNDIDRIRRELLRIQDDVHMLVPVDALSELPPGCSLSFSGCMLHPDPRFGHVYLPVGGGDNLPKDDDKVCLTFTAIQKLGNMAGVRQVPGSLRRVDDRSERWLRTYRVAVQGFTFDGSYKEHEEEYTQDFTDEGCRDQSITKFGDIKSKRTHIDALCQSKVYRRAIKQWLGLKSQYLHQEIREKPFVMACLKFIPDYDDPAVKLVVTAHFMGMKQAMFPVAQAAPAPRSMPGLLGEPSSRPPMSPRESRSSTSQKTPRMPERSRVTTRSSTPRSSRTPQRSTCRCRATRSSRPSPRRSAARSSTPSFSPPGTTSRRRSRVPSTPARALQSSPCRGR